LITKVLAAVFAASLMSPPLGLPVFDEIRDSQWHLNYLNIDDAHELSRGAGVIVGIVDTGADATHPDLAGRILPGMDFTGAANSRGDQDTAGHGTAMAGLIVANGRAIGIAPEATVLPARSKSVDLLPGFLTDQAIDWAVENGAQVLCLPFGATDGPRLERAVAEAIEHDIVVIAAMPNATERNPSFYPAAYPGVLAVVGTDRNGNHADISVTGKEAVLAAPAVDIMTTRPLPLYPTGYAAGTGTSDATAIVAGVAALIRSKYPDLSAAEVIHRMTATADDKGPPGRDDEYGYGIVNPVQALTADVPPLEPSASPTQARPSTDDTGLDPAILIAGIAAAAIIIAVGLALALNRRPPA
jgi:subtilisin family serine protease